MYLGLITPCFVELKFLIMTDTERIQEIIRAKNLNNIQFCSITGISPASLSHITSNRSKPTLTILRNVINGFPDINPEWVMMGTGPMFRNGEQHFNENEDDFRDFAENKENDKLPLLFDDDLQDNQQPIIKQVKPNVWPNQNNNANIEDIVKKTLTVVQKPQRKIVEVRIFFDDGTYETFTPNK